MKKIKILSLPLKLVIENATFHLNLSFRLSKETLINSIHGVNQRF